MRAWQLVGSAVVIVVLGPRALTRRRVRQGLQALLLLILPWIV